MPHGVSAGGSGRAAVMAGLRSPKPAGAWSLQVSLTTILVWISCSSKETASCLNHHLPGSLLLFLHALPTDPGEKLIWQ